MSPRQKNTLNRDERQASIQELLHEQMRLAIRDTFPLTNFRGEAVTINARGLYYWDAVSSASQMQANDLVTLVLDLPLLAVSFWVALRGSLHGGNC